MKGIIEEGIAYKLTNIDGSPHMYVGVTTKTLEEAMKKNFTYDPSNTICGSGRRIVRMTAEKGASSWHIEPLKTLRLCKYSELLSLKKEYIRLLKPNLNDKDGSCSDEQCEQIRRRTYMPWTCPSCLTDSRVGNKFNHRRTKYHRAIENLLFELD